MSHCCWFRVGSNFIMQFIAKYGVFLRIIFFASFPVHFGGENPDFDCTSLFGTIAQSVMDQKSILIAHNPSQFNIDSLHQQNIHQKNAMQEEEVSLSLSSVISALIEEY